MSKKTPKRRNIAEAEAVSRPEAPETQRGNRAARLLRADTLPRGGAMITENVDPAEGSETEVALKRAARRKS
jgi:hypothetical protein